MRIPAILSDSLIGAADLDDLFGNLQSGSSQSTQVDNSLSIILPILIVTVCLIALLVNYIIAKHMEDVAIAKGYDKKAHAFAMCFWLGPIGYIYVAMLPNKIHKMQVEALLLLVEALKENSGRNSDKD